MTAQVKVNLDRLIDDTVIYLNEPVLDDMYPDIMADEDKREEAIDWLIDRLEQIKSGEI